MIIRNCVITASFSLTTKASSIIRQSSLWKVETRGMSIH